MDMSVALGIIGIVVSIVVGVGTYYLAEKRGKRNRWQAAKDVVLRDLSKSLGEGNVPSPPVILATIRSVLRTQDAPSLEAVTLDEVTDDLLRQITSDPFLDPDRRTQLQDKVLEIKTTHLKEVEAKIAEAHSEGNERSLTESTVSSLAAAVGASLLAGLLVMELPRMFSDLKEALPKIDSSVWFLAMGAILTLTAAIGIGLLSRRNR